MRGLPHCRSEKGFAVVSATRPPQNVASADQAPSATELAAPLRRIAGSVAQGNLGGEKVIRPQAEISPLAIDQESTTSGRRLRARQSTARSPSRRASRAAGASPGRATSPVRTGDDAETGSLREPPQGRASPKIEHGSPWTGRARRARQAPCTAGESGEVSDEGARKQCRGGAPPSRRRAPGPRFLRLRKEAASPESRRRTPMMVAV